jgi:hypothetical protein
MIVIQRRYNGVEFEQMATYEDGELEGDDDFVEAFGYLFEDDVDESLILERFSGPNLVASIPEGEEGDAEGEEVEASAGGPETVELEKYRVYLGEAEDLSEAEENAPDWANVQEGTQGGFFYDTEDKPSEDGEDDEEYGDDEGLTSVNLSDGGFEVEEFDGTNIGVDLVDADVSQGDLLYVEHPDEANYIAEVDDVEAGYSDWHVDFGGGSYTLREGTNSQPVGLVEEEPELGEQETVVKPSDRQENIGEGDTVVYEDPAGYDHYVEVDAVRNDAGKLVMETEAGDLQMNDIDGVVEVEDPTEKYDLPDEQQITETTNISNPGQAVDFAENVAKAVGSGGDASSITCRKYQYYVGALQDEDLAIAAYQSIVNNDGSATHRDMIERQLRSMGVDPKSVHPETFGYDPDDVPPKRQNTKYENFDGEQATKAVAHVFQQNSIGQNNWSEWNDFFDSMTDDELEQAAKIALTNKIDRDEYGGDPMDYESSDMTGTAKNPDMYDAQRQNVSSCLSRIGRGSADRQREAFESIKAAVPEQHHEEIDELGAKWMHDAEVREEIFEQSNLQADYMDNPGLAMQFADDHETRAKAFLRQYVGSTTSHATKHARAALLEYGPNKGAQVSKFNKGIATESVEPADQMTETIDTLRDQTGDYIEEEHDGEVTLKRGVSDSITSNAAAESWTDDHSTASSFDGHAIMEATFEPGDIIACHEIEEQYDWGYYKHSHENEWTVLGGPLAEAVPDSMTPDNYYDEYETPTPETADV